MAKLFLVPINLNLNELQNPVIQNLAADPGSPVEGQIYWNTVSHVLKMYQGSSWLVVGRLDQISAPTADVAMATHKITGLGDPGAAQDAATQNYVLTRSLSALAAPTADVPWNAKKITGLLDPTTAQDAATKNYVDNKANGLVWKNPVRAATTANGTLATAFENGDVIDGVTLATGDRILLKNQTAGAENGIYVVAASGAPARATDADSAAELLQFAVAVEEGTANADTFWVNTTNAPITVDTTALVIAAFGAGTAYTAGTGLSLSTNVFSIENGGVLLPAHGGTGVASPTIHAVYVGNGTSPLTALAVGATGTVLRGQTGADPIWGAVVLTTDVTGVLPIANGGTAGSTAAAARVALSVPGMFSASFGDGAASSFNIDHNLNTKDVIVAVYRVSDGVEVEVDVTRSTVNRVVIATASIPTTNQYRATVFGQG